MVFAFGKNEVIFCQEKDYFLCGDGSCDFVLNEDNMCMWHPHDGMLIYVSSDHKRIIDIIRYYVDVPTELNTVNLNGFYTEICRVFDKLRYTPKDGHYGFYIIIADNKSAYDVSGNGIVTEIDKRSAIAGEYANYGSGVCSMMPVNMPAKEKLITYYKEVGKYRHKNYFPLVLMSTKNKKIEVIEAPEK